MGHEPAAAAMPSTRAQSQAAIAFPCCKSARSLARLPGKSRDAPAGPTASPTAADGPTAADPTALRLAPWPRSPAPHAPPPPAQALPLSPLKRLGDDNLCNVPQAPPSSPSKRGRKENAGRRLLFGEPPAPGSPEKRGEPGPSPRRQGQETPRSSEPSRLFRQEGSCYQQAKRVLHTAVPDRLPARERETGVITRFLREHVGGERPSSLYISGAPGTGKTACLSRVLQDCEDELARSTTIVLNCMALSSSQAIFPAVAEQLGLPAAAGGAGREVVRKLEKRLTAKGPMVLLVLDEMDQLDSKGQDVLYTVFEWPWLAGSRLVLIGMANALDLTERSLARLQARPGCRPQLLTFPPYTREQLASILQERLKQVPGDPVLDSSAVQFCARKVSAVSGDARKALDVCRRAVELVERDVRSQTVLKPRPGDASPGRPVPRRVGLPHVARVMAEVYGERMAAGSGGAGDSFPLQQKILVCSLLLLARHRGAREVTLGKLHDAYSRVCRRQRLAPAEQPECLALAALLEARGVLELKRAKEARLAKVSLKLEEQEVERALRDAALVGSILAQGLP
ncbi:cell division control protein 6 homolog isoform X4 [Dromaius novaehollandiae]|uniref:cell division control protein 6 homolog isoform X4 n=1 Tax=Dromaius novaehollandiae TaxID=8790 RepID=UPI00311EA7D5